MSTQAVLLSMGTRPEIIKMAPVFRALAASGQRVQVLHTGQHDTMAWPLYQFFGMRPHHSITLVREGESLAHLSAALLSQTQGLLQQAAPRAVLVHGDTSSAAMVALAAFYNQIPVGHVEAGLRSHDVYDPFPEEMNRALIGRMAHWHFAPTAQARLNLRRENVPDERIHCVGNSVVDAAQWAAGELERRPQRGLDVLPHSLATLAPLLDGRRLVLVTAHRRENWGGGISRIAAAVVDLVSRHDDLVVVWPVHANPAVRDSVWTARAVLDERHAHRLLLTEPLNYPAMMLLLARAWLALTDSGGIQEEAMSHRVPVLVLRETTERPELIECGAGVLVGTEPRVIANTVERLRADAVEHAAMRCATNPFGDGRTGERIAQILQAELQALRRAS